jgi:hypothetical protein
MPQKVLLPGWWNGWVKSEVKRRKLGRPSVPSKLCEAFTSRPGTDVTFSNTKGLASHFTMDYTLTSIVKVWAQTKW